MADGALEFVFFFGNVGGLDSIPSSPPTLNVYASEMPGSLEVVNGTGACAYNKESLLDAIEF